MELTKRVCVACAATILLFVIEAHAAPYGERLLSGFVSRQDPQPYSLGVKQLMKRYYMPQPDGLLNQYNPLGSIQTPLNYGQPSFDAYSALDSFLPYQQNSQAYAQDPYSQLIAPVQRGLLDQLPGSVEDSFVADRFSSQLDSMLAPTYAETSNQYKGFSLPEHIDSIAPKAPEVQVHEVPKSQVNYRGLPEGDAVDGAVSSPRPVYPTYASEVTSGAEEPSN